MVAELLVTTVSFLSATTTVKVAIEAFTGVDAEV
jgi:hypothetical protein